MRRPGHRGLTAAAAGVVGALLLAACGEGAPRGSRRDPAPPTGGATTGPASASTFTLAFAGDVHFEGGLTETPGRTGSTLGAMSRPLREADLAVVNLEAALTTRRAPARKELEDPADRYWFSTPPAALDVLDRAGVDVVTVANNHGADRGVAGLRDTVRAAADAPVSVIGAGLDAEAAFAPFRTTVQGTDVAVLAADASPRESADPTWAVAPGTGPGLASARGAQAEQLVEAVRASAAVDDLVVVYLHWGREGASCPTGSQEDLARTLSQAGADIVVGAHAHTPQGAGLLGDTYVSYGLGNFFWYHGRQSATGVLQLQVRGEEVVGDTWLAGEIPPGGGNPRPLSGAALTGAQDAWRALRGCTDLAPGPGAASASTGEQVGEADEQAGEQAGERADGDGVAPYTSTVSRIGPELRRKMTTYRPACPVALADLRHLSLSYVGFDGRSHQGELVVAADVADDVVEVFRSLHEARFPIQRMRLVDAYGGDDDRSMAANNTSGFNCRRVAGQTSWSDHAYGRAIDINPVQNPYVVGSDVRPPAARRYLGADRGSGGAARPGVIRAGDVVTGAFERIGWTWGATYAEPDYQHFSR